mgnify:CR=1 FL=1
MIASFIIKKLINWLCVRLAKYKYARIIGIYVSETNAELNLWNSYLKLFLESYFDICFCSMLNTIALGEAISQGNIYEHFSTTSNICVSVITLLYDLALIIFPIYAYLVIKKNFNNLSTKTTTDKYGFYYEDINLGSMITAQYNIIFMVRRLLTALLLVFMYDLPFF